MQMWFEEKTGKVPFFLCIQQVGVHFHSTQTKSFEWHFEHVEEDPANLPG